jgi:hypothetical protein
VKKKKMMKKLTKSMVCLAAMLVVAALTMGCAESPDPVNPLPTPISPEDPPTPTVGKATGGGWFYDNDTGNKCTFGFNAQYKDNPGAEKTGKMFTGQFQFKNHGTGEKFHLNEIILLAFDENEAHFNGSEKDGTCVYVYVYDAGEPGWSKGDEIAIWREPDDPEEDDPTWWGYISHFPSFFIL